MKPKTQYQLKLFNFQLNQTEKLPNNEAQNSQSQLNRNAINHHLSPQKLQAQVSAILSKPFDPKAERKFKKYCLLFKNSFYNRQLTEAYQEYVSAYHKVTSLYIIERGSQSRISLTVYDTETRKDEIKVVEIPEPITVSPYATLLPNGELFCCCRDSAFNSISLIINSNYEARVLPSYGPCYLSSAIYFNRSVYCFGGLNQKRSSINEIYEPWSLRFDLDQNRWIKLTPMSEPDPRCHSAVCNGNILISRFFCRKLLIYSIDIDSYSLIPYEFSDQKRKILMNAERLYLIEVSGLIYESEVEDPYTWKQIANSKFIGNPDQVYCSYNKGAIYIAGDHYYYNFDLNAKTMFYERLYS